MKCTCGQIFYHESIRLLFGISTDFDVAVVLPWRRKKGSVQNKPLGPRPLSWISPYLHGCLTGSNFLISDDAEARLIDFGRTVLVNSTFALPISTACIKAERLEECEPALQNKISRPMAWFLFFYFLFFKFACLFLPIC